MTLEEIFAAAREMKLHVHNLFEREDGRWQANVRERQAEGQVSERDYHHVFAVARGPEAAMIEAINQAVARRNK